MHTQKRHPRIGYGIDQVAYEMLRLGGEFIKLTPEGDDTNCGAIAAPSGHAIGLKTRAIDQQFAAKCSGCAVDCNPRAIL